MQDIISLRLNNHHLLQNKFENAADVVRHYGAVQAQDYSGALWSIGQRMKTSSAKDVEKSVVSGSIVRTWPMRGTLHFVAPENVRWMLKILTPRISRRFLPYYRRLELDSIVFTKAQKILERNLAGGKARTRPAIYKIFEENGISTKAQRGLFILGELAMNRFICFGPKDGKQQTFVLLDEWVTQVKNVSVEEGISRLAKIYFTSHGPAQIKDFCWWSGLTQKEAKQAVENLKSELDNFEFENNTYYLLKGITGNKIKVPIEKALLLPSYDEYTIAYKDRSTLMYDSGRHKELWTGNGYWSSMILNGKIIGTWRRTISKNEIHMYFAPMYKLSNKEKTMFEKEAGKYAKFYGMTVVIK